MAAKTQHDFILVGKDRASSAIKGVAKATGTLFDVTFKLTNITSSAINITRAFASTMESLGRAAAVPIKAAQEQQRVNAQLETVLRSTGMAAGLTSRDLQELGEQLSRTTTFSDQTTLAASNLLLTFTSISGSNGIFQRTIATSQDLAVAMGQDLNQSVLKLGKALNDPIRGVSELREVGISFTDQQLETIKALAESNRMFEAQTIVLDELDRQFGGSASALRETFGGAVASAQNSFTDFLEKLGEIVIENPAVVSAIDAVARTLEQMAVQVEDGEGAFGGLQDVITDFVEKGIVLFLNGVASIVDALDGGGPVMQAAFATGQVLTGLALTVVKLGNSFTDTGRVIGGVYAKLTDDEELFNELQTSYLKADKAITDLEQTYRDLGKAATEAGKKSTAAGDGLRDLALELEQGFVEAKEAADAYFGMGAEVQAFTDELVGLQAEIESVAGALPAHIAQEYMAEIQGFADFYAEALNVSTEAGLVAGQEIVFAMQDLLEQAKADLVEVQGTVAEAADIPKPTDEEGQEERRLAMEQEWARTAKSMSITLGQEFADMWQQSALDPNVNLRDKWESFSETVGQNLLKAVTDPFLNAPVADFFNEIFSFVGEMSSKMVGAIKDYFLEKFGLMKADQATEIATNQATQSAVVAQNTASAAATTASWTPAAVMASIATLGAALAFGFLISTVVSKVMGYEDGGFVNSEQLAMVGEGNKPEVIIPLSKPDRARELLAQTYERNPELFLGALTPRANRVSGSGGGMSNTFNITVTGGDDPMATSTAVVDRIDRMLGNKIKGRV